MKTPSILYKYRDYHNEYNKRILFNFEIFLPSTTMFNDPYEGSIPFVYNPEDLTEENLYIRMRQLAKEENPKWSDTEIEEYCYEAMKKDLLNDPKHLEEQRLENIRKIDATFGILSLTPKYLNYLMWSHYGNSHRGFCIGFDSQDLFNEIGGTIGPVVYQRQIPKMDIFGGPLEFYIKQLSTKSEIWQYEDEYRIVKADGSRETICYDKKIIRKIVLGCKMTQSEKQEIIDFVIKNEINCVISELSLDTESEFKLNELRIY
ncbi:hypothetical protein ADIS_0441 [Lunatimonas lonarensis]|uniref:DUF2971 domain-containing protein n=1 Tax=Lunatimonas lonarensis TaxID=1232681 RepID=R7ZYA2_9BACT|nr:DUF2971 domain-containing protein [Lunatimonas lonarensis]EON79024.1 hypothetical protein ADIS_0441 [Lunatimonas lonarensis]